MREHYIATEYTMSNGVGISDKHLPSFDKALVDAGVGNYNLVRLSSILPAHCKKVKAKDISKHIQEGSLLPTAYATISSSNPGEHIVSGIAIGFPEDEDKVSVIMEFSAAKMSADAVLHTLDEMVKEAFDMRGWKLKKIVSTYAEATVEKPGATYTTFACVAEW